MLYRVYIIQAGDTGPVKIGHCRDVYSRMASLQTGCWEELHLRGEFRELSLKQARGMEKALHRWLEREHIRGEWFRPRAIGDIFKAVKRNQEWQRMFFWHYERRVARPFE